MNDELIVKILEKHIVPQLRETSYDTFKEQNIRYLKNTGLLDCYFDYTTRKDMIFTTAKGKDYIQMYKKSVKLNALRDIVIGGDTSSENYRKAVEAVSMNVN